MLPPPDDPAFEEAYAAAVEGRAPKKEKGLPLPRAALLKTFGAAYRLLKQTGKWIAFDAATEAKNTHLIEVFLTSRIVPDHPLVWRDVEVRHMRRALPPLS